jgi:hypothetical protein
MKQYFFILLATLTPQLSALAFEGRIAATMTQGRETRTFLYTAGADHLRIERTETNWPHPVNIASLDELALVYPHNRSFVRLKSTCQKDQNGPIPHGIPIAQLSPDESLALTNTPAMRPIIGSPNFPEMPAPPPMPTMPQLPAGVSPQSGLRSGATPVMARSMIPPLPSERAEFKATDQTTNLLGYVCTRYFLKQRGEEIEIWATDKLLPFQPWLQNQPRRFGAHPIEEQWAEVLTQHKLFPLIASMKFDNGVERFRFEVKSITSQKVHDPDGALFQPPQGFHEVEPAPF